MFNSITSTLIAGALLLASGATASTLTERAALYGNNCDGSGLCVSHDISGDCQTGLALINRDTTYTDQAQFSSGHCYIIYATNGAGPQPVSGQLIYDTANTILNNCGNHCGSYGTNNNCPSCHVTLNYRS
ncbi:hypothetical protein OE88DRAFT_1642070 [Heliocybe sulcata]|uniref:Killer toxin n=1 Tax=Heliocybe sulcata TaxID=5364 RepID=A0A5C3NCJ8_9AGAM|nr:hypothetical protein OE88DRAFT_1642070 [Heliocybe sulcata]